MTSASPDNPKPQSPEPPDASASLPVIGWREHIALPDLGIDLLDARIDTGAKTSSLHAIDIEEVDRDGSPFVRFSVPAGESAAISCEASLIESRRVRSSNGESTVRPVVRTTLRLAGSEFSIEVTLTNRSQMRYPMLIGRSALQERFLVNVALSFACD